VDQWNKVAIECNAASITLTNDVDDEEIPHLDPSFRYIETGYN
jgi:histone-lysine N-methyltransferase SUV39H